MRTKLSEHFYRDEFACPCGCGFDTVDVELVTVLEKIREQFGCHAVTINSGARCKEHNAEVGGGEKSQHLFGKAADFVIRMVNEQFVADTLEDLYPDKYGIGRYPGRTHVDVRETKARWTKNG